MTFTYLLYHSYTLLQLVFKGLHTYLAVLYRCLKFALHYQFIYNKKKAATKSLQNGGQAALPTVSCGLWSTLPSQALQVSLFILLLWYKCFHSPAMPRHLWDLYSETAKCIFC